MPEKQFTALRVTLTGAAFFIGGAVLALEEWEPGVLFMLLGGFLLIKDAAYWAFSKCVEENGTKTEEKDGKNGQN